MDLNPLPFSATPEEYRRQAAGLLAAHGVADADAIRLLHRKHPRFADSNITWLQKELPPGTIEAAALDIDDAQLALARWHDFRDWAALQQFAHSVAADAGVPRFETAVEAVVDGAADILRQLVKEDPPLVRARSTRVTMFDPPVHAATLLHYIAANGVEEHRQRTPLNAVVVARILLEAGAEVDALAAMYGVNAPP